MREDCNRRWRSVRNTTEGSSTFVDNQDCKKLPEIVQLSSHKETSVMFRARILMHNQKVKYAQNMHLFG